MHRAGIDPANVQPKDVLCDFCHGAWDPAEPFLEGHKGSVICGKCLTVAYGEVVNDRAGSAPAGYACTLCLQARDEPGWQSPAYPEAAVCGPCIELAAKTLARDRDYNWKPPVRA